jgi:hypothetical protein
MRIAILGGVLAFVAVIMWKWPETIREAPVTRTAVTPRAHERGFVAAAPPSRVRESRPNKDSAAPAAVVSPGRTSVISMSSAQLARASIVPLIDESGESVAWRLASPAGDQLETGRVIVAVNGRGLSNGGAGELKGALEKEAPVALTLAQSGTVSALTEAPASLTVGEQLAADSVAPPARHCRLDPSKFRSVEDYRRTVYALSLRDSAEGCDLPGE